MPSCEWTSCPAAVQRLQRDVERLCGEKGAQLIDFVVDQGIPKDHATEYPALAYLRNGLADVLLVVRAPVFDAADLVDVEDSADMLESYLLPAKWRRIQYPRTVTCCRT